MALHWEMEAAIDRRVFLKIDTVGCRRLQLLDGEWPIVSREGIYMNYGILEKMLKRG